MYAERMIVETDPDGNLKQLPKLPANCRLEAIFLVMDEQPQSVRPLQTDSLNKVRDLGSSMPDAVDALLAESYGAWGKRPVTEVTAIIEAQRRLDWGDE